MEFDWPADVYTLGDIASAANSTEEETRAVAGNPGSDNCFWSYADAVRIGRLLVAARYIASTGIEPPLFSQPADRTGALTGAGLPLVVSGSLHLGLLGVLLIAFGLAPTAAATNHDELLREQAHLIFLVIPGPGGGGGGGGALTKAPPPKAESEGHGALSSPLPPRVPPAPAVPAEPKPKPLVAEQLPALMAPIIAAPADARSRNGLLEQATARDDSRGEGRDDGVGSGTGSGIGEGTGAGIGPGSGGGIGGGPYRPGSGISPPRVLHEVKADYSEDARRRGLTGEVVLEIVVRRDGSVGDVKVLQGLGSGLDERAIQAVRQWRFSPADRLGMPVDVIVEVGVEFRLR